MTLAHEEIIDFILAGKTPERVASFQASDTVKARVDELIRREKNEGLSAPETAELDAYMQLEHLMRLAKSRARKMLLRARPAGRGPLRVPLGVKLGRPGRGDRAGANRESVPRRSW
jgi:hypothetical protein